MTLRRRLATTLLLLGALAWPAAAALDLAFGTKVTILARVRTQAERAAWRARGWDPRDGVAELYGTVEPPAGLRVLLLDRDRLIVPEEDPRLRLLPVDRRAGEDVLTTRALHGRAVAAAVLLLALGLLVRARSRTA